VPGCDVCHEKCLTASAWKVEDQKQNPMPLSDDGMKILDAAIRMLKEEARKEEARKGAELDFFP